jgi:NitT/TauT family transport system ATP-binding protein
MNATPKIRIADVSVTFPAVDQQPPFVALDRVSLDIGAGEFVCIVGPSGCGKTTLLRAIAGLATSYDGAIEVDGKVVRGPGRDRSVVFQYDCLLPWRTVLKNVLLGWDIHGGDRKEAERKALHYLEMVGLGPFARYYPHQLSGGMRQRVNLARALAIEPDILLMDEPFAALDAQTREVMQAELLRIWNSFRRTVVFITHQVDEAIFLADRVVVMGTRPGRVLDTFDVPFERPRDLALKGELAFTQLTQRVWSKLAVEGKQSVLARAV